MYIDIAIQLQVHRTHDENCAVRVINYGPQTQLVILLKNSHSTYIHYICTLIYEYTYLPSGVGRELMTSAQSELTIGNLIRRVLFFIREEYATHVK